MGRFLKRLFFCLTQGATFRDSFKLLYLTLRFIIGRRLPLLGVDIVDQQQHLITFRGLHQSYTVYLRTQDMPIYHEVWMEQIYYTTDEVPSYILDIGANVGLTALYFADKYPNSTVIAVEPSPSNYGLLTKNIRQCSTILVEQLAVASADGTAIFDDSRRAYNTQLIKSGVGINVDTISMSSLMTLYKISPDNLLVVKMDIEGGELDVFEGDTTWLSFVSMLLIEVHSDHISQLVTERCRQAGLILLHKSGDVLKFRKTLDIRVK